MMSVGKPTNSYKVYIKNRKQKYLLLHCRQSYSKRLLKTISKRIMVNLLLFGYKSDINDLNHSPNVCVFPSFRFS